jgi:hypothetical protein
MKQYAKDREVSYELIRRYCKQGRITLKNKLINPEVADKELEENVAINGNSKLAKGSAPRSTVTDTNHTVEYNKAKARREKSKADLAELEFKEKAGLLISVVQVEREAETLYRQYRDQMLNVVIRATKKLLGETSEFKFRRILKVEIENAIQKIK